MQSSIVLAPRAFVPAGRQAGKPASKPASQPANELQPTKVTKPTNHRLNCVRLSASRAAANNPNATPAQMQHQCRRRQNRHSAATTQHNTT